MDRALYPHWRREPLRFLDMDAQGHVNNLALGAIAENSRAFFMNEVVTPLLDSPADAARMAAAARTRLGTRYGVPALRDTLTAAYTTPGTNDTDGTRLVA